MTDFAVLPPEVTSTRIYAGPGSGPLMAAAAAWDRLSATLSSAAGSYQSTVTELTDETWRGPASAAMTAASEPYVTWMTTTAAQAGVLANQARAAAAAYEAAHAGVVPPPVIAANRAELQTLVNTNVLGQNSAAIAANQADYAAMWAQDAAVMHGYRAGAAAATKPLTTFNEPPQAANPAANMFNDDGLASTSGYQALASGLHSFLNSPAMTNNPWLDFTTSPLVEGFNTFNNETAGLWWTLSAGQFGGQGPLVGGTDFPTQGAIAAMYTWTALHPESLAPFAASSTSGAAQAGTLAGGAAAAGGAAQPALAGGATGAVSEATLAGAATTPGSSAPNISAGLGRAMPVGGLSAPGTWAAAAPQEIRLASASLPTAVGLSSGGVAAAGGLGGAGMMPMMMGGMGNSAAAGRTGAQPDGAGKTAPQPAAAVGGGVGTEVLSPQREELNRLRNAVVEMTMQRDALRRSAASVIRRVKKR